MGLTSALAAAGHSLEVFRAGIETAGQNITNAQTPGYVREELVLTTDFPQQRGNLLIGTGVRAFGVRQQIDMFIESRIHSANADVSASRVREAAYRQLEAELGELGESDLSTSLNDFLASLNEVVNRPESAELRQLAIGEGQRFADKLRHLRVRIDELRTAQTTRVEGLVKEANSLIDQVRDLNKQIAELEISGLLESQAGALRTQRYNALNRLSEIIPIRAIERRDGTLDIFTGSEFLVLGGQTQHLTTFREVDRGVSVTGVRLDETGASVSTAGGELQGIIDARDTVMGEFVDRLDEFASSFIFAFNRIHSSGEGLKGFTSLTGTYVATDQSAPLNAAGLAFTPQHGSFQLKVVNQASGLAATSTIAVDLDGIGADTTLETLRDAIDAVDNLSAEITTTGELRITADNGYEFRFANDTSGVLAALGLNTFFVGSDSAQIDVNPLLVNDHAYLATGQGGGTGDGSNALLLAQLPSQPLDELGDSSLDELYESMVTEVAHGSASETALTDGFETFRDSLRSQREQISGVSLDEETLKIMNLQRSFATAARLISTIDELMTILISL